MVFFVILHVIICILLITVILIQRGRGAGLVERFSGIESIFGPKTSSFLVRITNILAVLFMFSCLILAGISLTRSRSLMRRLKEKTDTSVKTQEIPQKTALPQEKQESSQSLKETKSLNETSSP